MNRVQLKAESKRIMKDANPRVELTALVYVVILIVIGFLSFKLFGEPFDNFINSQFGDILSFDFETGSIEEYDAAINAIDPEQVMYAYQEYAPSPLANLLNTALKLMGTVIGAGFVIFCLRTADGSGASVWNLFDGFEMFFRIVWLYILESIFIFLWALLFIIPGFIAFYRYRMAIYLLLEHPEMSANQCLNESSRIMKTHKLELFVLDLSFIGWALLVGFVSGIGLLIGEAAGITILNIIGLGYIIYIWFLPFFQITQALFYRQLTAVPEQTWNPEF